MLGWNHVFLYFDEPDDPSIRHVRTWEGQSVPHVDPDCDEKREQREQERSSRRSRRSSSNGSGSVGRSGRGRGRDSSRCGGTGRR